jgi:hypothetical protein
VQAADEGLRLQRVQVFHLVEVNPGRKGPLPGPAQNDGADFLVLAALIKPLTQGVKHGGAQQIQSGPPLNTEGGDGILLY